MSTISYCDVIDKFMEAYELPSRSDKRLLSESYVFDEEKSVKWNKEQVKKHNQTRADEDLRFRKAYTEAVGVANGMAGEYLAQEYNISKNVGVKVFLFAKREKDDAYQIDDILDYAKEICRLFKEE